MFEVDERLWLDEHFEGATLLQETVRLDVRGAGEKTRVPYALLTDKGIGKATRKAQLTPPDAAGTQTL